MFKDAKFVITTILAIAAILVPILWNYILPGNKELSFELLSQLNLSPSIETDINLSDLKVSIDGQNVESPYVSYIKIENNGKTSISKSDYEAPLIIEVSENQKIIRSTIVSKNPNDIDTEISYNEKNITISPSLLNPSDNIFIQILTENGEPKFGVHGRINGVKNLELTRSNSNEIDWSRVMVLLLTTLLLSIPTTISIINYFIERPTHKIVNGLQNMASFIGIELLSISLMSELNLNGINSLLLIFLSFISISTPLGYYLNKQAQ